MDELKARQCLLAEEMHKSYVPREDCRGARRRSSADWSGRTKNWIASRTRSVPGALTCAESAGTPRASGRLCRDTGGTPGTGPAGLHLLPAGVFSALLPRRGIPASRMAGCGTARMADTPEGVRLAIGPAREAKSTFVSLFFVLWAVLTGRKHYI
ncbi:MAG: hypothetical protein ACLRWP_04240 [Bilophila wadsworthia]